MKVFKRYQGVDLPRNQSDFVDFIQTGSNNFWEAYYIYTQRKQRVGRPTLTIASWFNRQLKRIHQKGLLKDIPFVYSDGMGHFIWQNPGVRASKADFVCFTLHDANMELKREVNKIF